MSAPEDEPRLRCEVWAGVECTVRRVGDGYVDQLDLNGHSTRGDDIRRFASLGIRTFRYPVLWERVAPFGVDRADWSWTDERLGVMRELGLEPIAGLLHHGSGPRYTSLVDPDFPAKLAEYAAAVAQRYPWMRRYTPVNEPLTTARFSGLYGFWYPHGRNPGVFARALINQCKAVALAMRAIRSVVPEAELVQTEDLAKCYSTRPLGYQADFENERRWASFDLLCGKLPPGGRVWGLLRESGIAESELEWFAANPVPPDILGLNYYVTSERFLDHRLPLYCAACHGGNGRDRYADVEAVRAREQGIAGPQGLLREVWERYQLPLAVTEVHLGGSREAQLQWLAEIWTAACGLRGEAVDLRAITAWSLLGAFDWNSLLTRNDGQYESGVFDVRGAQPRETALAAMLRTMAAGQKPCHPVLQGAGWWRRPERMFPSLRPRATLELVLADESGAIDSTPAAPILITGASGTLGRAFATVCRQRGLAFRLLCRREMDIADAASVAEALRRHEPWAVVNAAGYVRVDDAEQDSDRCFRENTVGPATLAEACCREGVKLLSFSSDLVFDGLHRRPYLESDPTAPLGCYGRSKADAERRILQLDPSALVVRSSAFFGPWDQYNYLAVALESLRAGRGFRAATDARVSPTYVPDLVNMSLDLLIDDARGVWHLANRGEVSWFEFAALAAEGAGVGRAGLQGVRQRDFGYAAPRPEYSVLGSEHGHLLPDLETALGRYLADAPLPAAA